MLMTRRVLLLGLFLFIVGCSGPAVVRPSQPAKPPTEPGTFSKMPNLK
jgi:hypothetical protein